MDFDADFRPVLLVLCVAILAHAWVVRRLAVGFIDPIVYTALGTTAAITMSFALSGGSIEFVRVATCVCIFWAGVWSAWPGRAVPVRSAPASDLHQRQFRRIVAISALLFVVANVLFFAVAGPPALADNPTLAKVDSYAGGFGVVRRLDWGLGVFVIVGLTYLLLTTRPRWALWAYGAFIVISGLSGSKSALLPVLFAFALFRARPEVREQSRANSRWLNWLLPVLVVCALGLGIGVLVLEKGDIQSAVVGFLVRILYSGDVLIYWETPGVRHAFRSLNAFDYLTNLMGPTLGGLRLVDYSAPIGSQMVQLSLGLDDEVSESLGPNVPFYVKGEIFFGVGQYVYAFLSGTIIGWLRRRYARSGVSRPFGLCVATTLVLMSPALSIDDTLFISTIIDLLVALALVWLAASAWPLRPADPPAVDRTALLGPEK